MPSRVLAAVATSLLIMIAAPWSGVAQAEPAPQTRGCCSHHGGVCGCSGGRATCCDGVTSPACKC